MVATSKGHFVCAKEKCTVCRYEMMGIWPTRNTAGHNCVEEMREKKSPLGNFLLVFFISRLANREKPIYINRSVFHFVL